MKRKFWIALLIACLSVIFAFALIACGETEKPDGGNGGNGDNGGATIVTPGGDTGNSGGNQGGEQKTATEGLKFNLLDDDTYEVIGYDGASAKIDIPAEYNGKKVTRIGEFAFYTCTGVTDITIPDSVTNIGINAFVNCNNLNYNEYDNAKYLGNADNLYLVLIEVKNRHITNCNINAKTKLIYNRAFWGCDIITSIDIPNGVKSIGDSVFNRRRDNKKTIQKMLNSKENSLQIIV